MRKIIKLKARLVMFTNLEQQTFSYRVAIGRVILYGLNMKLYDDKLL